MSRILGRDRVVRPLGVIDTLTAGYEVVNRRLWLLLFPIALDLLFWLGPKLSIVRAAGYLPLPSLGLDEPAPLIDALAHFNLIFLLALYVPTVLGKPPYVPVGAELSSAAGRDVYQLLPGSLPLTVLALVPLGLLVGALYLGGIGQLVRADAASGNRLRVGARYGRYWWRMLVLHVLAAPWVLALVIGLWLSLEVGGLLLLLFQVSLLWAVIYFFFALDALIVTDVSALRAALSSVQVVRANFWSAVALIGLMLVIGTGLPIVWRALSGQPLGLVASIVGNAYVGTGLAAASMLYYRDRAALLRGHTIGKR